MLKKIAAMAALALAVSAGGHALADGTPRAPIKDAPLCCAATSWSSFYICAGIGYGHLQAENNFQQAAFSQSWDGEGAAGGFVTLVLGVDRQVHGRFVVGAFVEYELSNIELRYIDSTVTSAQTFRLENSVNVGVRAGILLTPTSLFFATAGYSWARGKNDGYFDIQPTVGPLLPGKSAIDLHGPFVGLGMETDLGRNLALRGEARYTMFGDEVVNSGVLLGNAYEDRFKADVLSARLTLTYKFHRDRTVEPVK
jgi:outer membrane immunogenic protein